MSTSSQGHLHPTGDEALSFLANMPGALGDLVRSYPGVRESDDQHWLDQWFRSRTRCHYEGSLSSEDAVCPLDQTTVHVPSTTVARPVRIVSVQPHYFRGFREVPQPIPVKGELVVIDGRNSSGKTSLAEALEWLFAGSLSRRESRELGNYRELENCVGNQFRPEDEQTWVTATFVTGNSGTAETFTLKRVQTQDYGISGTSRCESTLFLNDSELALEQERQEMDRLFASVPPLLMQHTLRLFVESTPAHRREYFERLLRLDELTNLISKAVVGDARLPDFPSPTGSIALTTWGNLATMVETDGSKKLHRQTSRTDASDLVAAVRDALTAIGRQEFPVQAGPSVSHEEIRTALEREQPRARQASFPLLARFRPRRQIADDQPAPTYATDAANVAKTIREAWTEYKSAKEAAQTVGRARLEIARVLKILVDAGLVHHDAAAQHCPLCAYSDIQTLSRERIVEIEGWTPTYEREHTTRSELEQRMRSVINIVRKALEEHDELLPPLPAPEEIDSSVAAVDNDLRDAVHQLRRTRDKAATALGTAEGEARGLVAATISIPSDDNACEDFIAKCITVLQGLESVPNHARRYREALRSVESAVGALARVDPKYRLREGWLAGAENAGEIAGDLRWERAKRHAQKDLKDIREQLIDYRNRFLEARRASFNSGIQEVWSALRRDEYSVFSQLHIPAPRGLGFPVEIEVKALLDDGTSQKEVDALRVFSESQVNALGIAAFVTRSKLLGHGMLIFDDPVQSMDEDHFKTFARDVIPHVLSQSFQVILLTHNDTFARDVSYWHKDQPGYVTMSVRHSRREGCVVEAGNRRVAERLQIAEKLAKEGRLGEAWRYVRLAIERLYTVAYAKYGPAGFDPENWRLQTAGYMWGSGADDIIESRAPGAGKRLKEILDMTAAGSHDKAPRGETDLRNSTAYLKSLLGALRVGG